MAGRQEPADAAPLSAAEFAVCFAGLGDCRGSVLVAVSGGPDSTALMHGLAAWADAPNRPTLLAATVDHGLRPEARAEADAVGQAAAALGLPHHILTWTPPAGRTSQDRARRARYALLLGLAARTGATTLVTAHTRDDQAETVLMRMAAGSGLSGLAGMRRVVARGAVRHVRPLLDVAKMRLVATCREQGWSFVDDPSNANPAYARARWRRLTPLLAAEGLDAERLATLAARLARAEAALDEIARTVLARVAAADGSATLDFAALAKEPDEIGLRALAFALRTSLSSSPGLTRPPRPILRDGRHGPELDRSREPSNLSDRGGRVEPDHDSREAAIPTGTSEPALRLERLEACYAALRTACTGAKRLRRTLAGRQVTLDRTGRLTIEPEPPRRRGVREVTEIAAGAPHSLGRGDLRA